MEDIHDIRQRAVGAGMLDSAVDKEKFPFAKANIAALLMVVQHQIQIDNVKRKFRRTTI